MLQSHARGRTTTTNALITGLGWFSIALGLTELLAPRRVSGKLGMAHKAGILQTYGLREIGHGLGILISRNPTPWIWSRVAGDALDIGTLLMGLKSTNPRRSYAALALTAVSIITLLDIFSARQIQADRAAPREPVRDYSDRSGFPEPPEKMRGRALNGHFHGGTGESRDNT